MNLQGVIAAAATPVTPEWKVDNDRLIEHCRWLLGPGGCDGINLLGTTGEAASFSAAQRHQAMEAVAKAGLPLDRFMVGTGASALKDTCRLTAAARDLGFAGALVIPPFYYKTIGQEGIQAYFDALIANTGRHHLRLYLYNFPAMSSVPYDLPTVMRLTATYPEQILGLKDSSGDLAYSSGVAKSLPGFLVFPSAEGSMERATEMGFAGCISATANVTGPFAGRAWRSDSPEDKKAALKLASEVRATISRFPLVASVKAALSILRKDPNWLRLVPPLMGLSPKDADTLSTNLQKFDWPQH